MRSFKHEEDLSSDPREKLTFLPYNFRVGEWQWTQLLVLHVCSSALEVFFLVPLYANKVLIWNKQIARYLFSNDGFIQLDHSLQSVVCRSGSTIIGSHMQVSAHQGKENSFIERERKLERLSWIVHGFSLAASSLGKKRNLSFVGLCYYHRAWEHPLLVSQL